uniref:Uncharacterized protein n=1 Tax=Solibacter usitatus (strain Ellin6076) TaxID=234267 RepID=Q021T5_SOLUE
MISEKRSQAARINGAKSRGPVTPEGKAIAARNAMRHGFLAKTVVLCNEDKKTFEALFYLLIERFSPVDDIEMSAIEEMAASHWRMRRVMNMEHALLDSVVRENPDKTFPGERTLAAFTDPTTQATLALLQRYEARFQNMYHRALRSLLVLRKLPARAAEPNEPKESNLCNTDLAEPTPIRRPEQPVEQIDPLIPPLISPDLEFDPLDPAVFR